MLERSVPVSREGERVDRFLATAQTDLSRSRIQALIREGRVTVNGRAARASTALRAGDRVCVALPEPRATTIEPEAGPLVIVHEDEAVIVVDKPAGLVVHPGAGNPRGTLVHALLHRYPEIVAVGGEGRPGIVHRLDKDTSGLLVVARTAAAHRALVALMRERRVHRRYVALVWGDVRSESGRLEGAIGRDPSHRKRMAVVRRGGKPAVTHWRVHERFGIATRLDVELDTGRTHQIRVHLAHAGHPVVGDAVYGGRGKKLLSQGPLQRSLATALLGALPRQALHASELDFPHPMTGGEVRFRSPLPEDLAGALEQLRLAGGPPRP
jgi:23S rRNA pseudouridine1911/1915/1917 synthase